MKLFKFAIAAAALPLLAACAAGPDIQATKNMSNTSTPFNKALQVEYAELAMNEADEWDTEDAIYFNNKAIAAAKGEDVGPQEISERNVSGDAAAELEAARQALRATLLSGGKDWAPDESAMAQTRFDCWLQEQEEGDQPEHINACKLAFDEALAAAEAKRPRPVIPARAPAALPPIPGPFVIYFDFDSFDLTSTAEAVISQAAVAGQAAQITGVQVVGHTDSAGSADYNEGLGRARAATVRNQLIVEGFTRDQTVRSTKGESEQAVRTEDGVREARNRRVTITFTR